MWYVIRVSTGHEGEACLLCQRVAKAGEEVFLLRGEGMRRLNGGWASCQYRLFPGHIFVETEEPADFCQRLHSALGEKGEAMEAGLSAVEKEEADFLRLLSGAEHLVRAAECRLRQREPLRLEGFLEGQEARIRQIDRQRRRALVETSLFGQRIDLRLPFQMAV